MQKDRSIFKNILVLFSALLILLLSLESIAWLISSINRHKLDSFRYMARDDNRQPTSFRKAVSAEAPQENEVRIVVLGDSFTWGHYIADPDDLWTSALEEILAKEYPNKKISIINLALRGFTTVNEYELLCRLGTFLSPDLIIVQYTLNDPLLSNPHFASQDPEEMIGTNARDIIKNKKIDLFMMHSKLYNFLNNRFKTLQHKLNKTTIYDPLYNDNFKGWISCKKAMNHMVSKAREHNSESMMVIFPAFSRGRFTSESYPYNGIHEKVFLTAKDAGFYVLDLLHTFIEEKRDFSQFMALNGIDGHPNAHAHALAGDSIARYIIKERLIPTEKKKNNFHRKNLLRAIVSLKEPQE